MTLMKTVLLVILCTAAFPAIGNAKPSQNQVVYAAKRGAVSSFFIRVLTLGHKGR